MKNVKIVIGANWGDEGKGLMTDYFASLSNNSLVVCHNGGCQKGHTVTTPDDIRHIFHHFGAGAFVGADTYLASTYILNPMVYRKEYEELKNKGGNIKCYINKDSIFTTPYDVLINQLIEQIRDKNKHGSCGLGIFETINRNNHNKITIGEFVNLNYYEKIEKLKEIIKFYKEIRIPELNIFYIPDNFMELFENENIILNYLDDLEFLIKTTKFTNDSILEKYENIIFEGAQGLALDQNNKKYWPHLTPSNTGSKNPINILSNFDLSNINIEVCYITRSYYTRHGAGEFEFECKKENINPEIIDLTNVSNPYQESIRYGHIDLDDLYERIYNDYNQIPFKTKLSIAITHLNYTKNQFSTKNGLVYIPNKIKSIYMSDGQTRKNIKK
jgi:adenylosuccinate synthase